MEKGFISFILHLKKNGKSTFSLKSQHILVPKRECYTHCSAGHKEKEKVHIRLITLIRRGLLGLGLFTIVFQPRLKSRWHSIAHSCCTTLGSNSAVVFWAQSQYCFLEWFLPVLFESSSVWAGTGFEPFYLQSSVTATDLATFCSLHMNPQNNC